MLHLVQTRYGALKIAVDIQALHSVLTQDEARGIALIDAGPHLGLAPEAPERRQHIGLLAQHNGPPMGVYLGQIERSFSVSASALYPLSAWIKAQLCPLLHAACLFDSSGEAIWLLNTSELLAVHSKTARASSAPH